MISASGVAQLRGKQMVFQEIVLLVEEHYRKILGLLNKFVFSKHFLWEFLMAPYGVEKHPMKNRNFHSDFGDASPDAPCTNFMTHQMSATLDEY